jgi:phage terminase small subunit
MTTRAAKAKADRALRHPLPDGLGDAGADLWRAVVSELVESDSEASEHHLDSRELYLLRQAAHTADRIAALEVAVRRDGETTTGSRGQVVLHPAVSEIRQAQLAVAKMLGSIQIADADAGPQTVQQRRASKASRARWDRRPRSVKSDV